MTTNYETIRFEMDGRTARVTLARPAVRNAFNEVLIAELLRVLDEIENLEVDGETARVLVLTGEGTAFCAGADLGWMGKMRDYSFTENLADSLELAKLMRRIYEYPLPTIAMVNGATIGGGNGLVAACDIAVAADTAVFSLSEVKIGLVPACIGPYVIKRIGERAARELFLTGERIDAARARAEGLVNEVAAPADLAERVNRYVKLLLSSGPAALGVSKELIRNVPGMDLSEAGPYTAKMIAKLRISDEAQEGMAAFFEKRRPRWADPNK
ncbi:MAG: enoyl-CoA hydratase-related protein [Planctomycetota bacterium]